ncbi:MAG: twin-arginine translocase TatA/TatE family subunit [Acidobacteriota bacterium]
MGLGWQEILILLLILVLLFGARKLPEIGRGLGDGIRSFKRAIKGEGEDEDEKKSDKQDANV